MSKVIEQLKQIQADAQVFYIKVHNFHWNARGMDFHSTHKSTQEIYEKFAEIFDDLAERVLQLGSTPYVTLQQILQNAKIKEVSSTEFDSRGIMEAILSDYKYFLDAFLELSNMADEANDKITAAYADENVANLQKAIWMLQAQLN
ncbi:MAG: DNA starvation/stationary phase protection protein [Helicobacter sp.]|uniref:Dps family protein n=1 Tax=Helicobacter sp. 10-6591 TaxID=2004998 RepID=UPI000DCB7D3C|nr:DNA starvation/stationary phase protection protein [Helicobacter sp. 10-6591]MCI6218124.1 DNA starvation/stationary phase protection protein [Helicobacter sp.]MCI7485480.1 DNA starvation/stationary phase protection protein [Helicobacter sp.]MDD7567025.1 DNA starvation/stationary phase protection protein [Helicobacter sp.]MDY5740771.1 DNA starvation/stationary phase protection protein [Helicobacter sp.]RAX55391.1 DNA starvation/stationary phase protection protein [Helicobacter sp. 10-6591]